MLQSLLKGGEIMANPADRIFDKNGQKVVSGTTVKAKDADVEKFGYNMARRQDLCDKFLEQYAGIINNTRNNRKTLEENWLDDYRQWSCRTDGKGYVAGFNNIFVPEFHHQIETTVEKALSTNFPGPDWIYAVPMKGTTLEAAAKIKSAVLNELENKNNIFVKSDEFERQKALAGTSVWKGSFRKEMLTIYTRDTLGKAIKVEVPKYYGANWDVVDIFKWYIYPESSSLDDCMVCFEDMFQDVKQAKKNPDYVNMDNVQPVDWDTNHLWVDTELLEFVFLSTAIAGRPGCAVFTEAWCDFEIRKGLTVPVKAVIANHSVVVQLIRNPFWTQQKPYLADTYIKRPGKMFYGFSVGDKLRSSCYTMTDTAGQTFDSISYANNPIVIIDPALAGDVNSMKLQPGAKWLGSPEGIQFTQFTDVSQSGLRAMSELRGMIAQFSDNAPGVAPQLQGKSRSATQATIVSQAVTSQQRVRARSSESNVYGPMCNMTHMFLSQFMDSEWPIRMRGPDEGSWISDMMKPTDLVGAVDFVWKGSSQAEKTAIRNQQLLALMGQSMQMMAVLPPGEFDIAALFMKVAKEAFGLEDTDQLFKSLRDKVTFDPKMENIGLYDVQELPVYLADNDDKHIEEHSLILKDKKATEEQQIAALRHIEKHELQKKGKDAIIQAQAKMRAMQMSQLNQGEQAGGEAGGGPQPPSVPGVSEGNQAQAMSSPASVMTATRGVDSQV